MFCTVLHIVRIKERSGYKSHFSIPRLRSYKRTGLYCEELQRCLQELVDICLLLLIKDTVQIGSIKYSILLSADS